MESGARLPAGITSDKVEPGALLLTAPRYSKPHQMVEVVRYDFDHQRLEARDEQGNLKLLSIAELRDATLLRGAPNLIDDYLGPEAYEDPPETAALFARCDRQLATARAGRYRAPRR